jgi:hypothetical protein
MKTVTGRWKILAGVLLILMLALGLGYTALANSGGTVTVKFAHGEGGPVIAEGDLTLTAPEHIGDDHTFLYWMVDGERREGRTIAVDMAGATSLEAVYNPETIIVDIPAGTYVNVSGFGWFQDGDEIDPGESTTIKYQAYDAAKTYGAGWKYASVEDLNGVLAPSYCNMQVNIPVGTWVNISEIGRAAWGEGVLLAGGG